jgi:hypothetical protein
VCSACRKGRRRTCRGERYEIVWSRPKAASIRIHIRAAPGGNLTGANQLTQPSQRYTATHLICVAVIAVESHGGVQTDSSRRVASSIRGHGSRPIFSALLNNGLRIGSVVRTALRPRALRKMVARHTSLVITESPFAPWQARFAHFGRRSGKSKDSVMRRALFEQCNAA